MRLCDYELKYFAEIEIDNDLIFEPRGSIDLRGAVVKDVDALSFTVKLATWPARTHHFKAKAQSDKNEWVTAISSIPVAMQTKLAKKLTKVVFKGAHVSLSAKNKNSSKRQNLYAHGCKQDDEGIDIWQLLGPSGCIEEVTWEQLEERGAQSSTIWSALQSSSGDEAHLCVRHEGKWLPACFKSPAPGKPAELSGATLLAAELHTWNHFERLFDTSSAQLLDIGLWEKTLQDIVKKVATSFLFVEDTVSGVRLKLEKQTIYLESANRANKRMDAHDLAKLICSGVGGKCFDREFAGQENKGLLTIADAGSGKSWMIQQVALAICKRFENGDDFVPLVIPVQSIFGSMESSVINAASLNIEAFLRSFLETLLEAEGPIMGVDLSHTMYLSFMQAFRARRYGRGVGVGMGSTFVLLFPIDS